MRAIAILLGLSMSFLSSAAAPRRDPKMRPVPLEVVHVCIEHQNGATDYVHFMSRDRPGVVPSAALAADIRRALRLDAIENHKSLDLALAADEARFVASFRPVVSTEPYLPPEKPTPRWGDDEPQPPPAPPRYDCVCATALFDKGGGFSGCTVEGCNGCQICREL